MKKQIIISLISAVLLGTLLGIVGMTAITGASGNSNSNSALDISSVENSNFIVKTDENGALPTLSKEQLIKACDSLSGEQKSNALSFVNAVKSAEDKYKVNAVFSLSVFRKENGLATNKSGILGHGTYNIGSLKGSYNGNSYGEWRKYNNYDEAIMDYADNIANGSYYFKAGKYTLKEIGTVYCTPPDEWIKIVKEYMIEFYKSAGVSTGTDSGTVANGGKGTIGVYTSTSGKKYNLYLQGGNAPWADNDYGNDHSMAKAGCGPTAEAIIASAYNGSITPETARADIVKKYGTGNHSSADVVAGSLKRLVPNIKAEAGNYDDTKVKNCLKGGGQIWLVVQHCKYTSNAHCIALVDYKDNGKVYVAHGSASSRPYGWDDLSYIKQYLKYSSIVYVGGN